MQCKMKPMRSALFLTFFFWSPSNVINWNLSYSQQLKICVHLAQRRWLDRWDRWDKRVQPKIGWSDRSDTGLDTESCLKWTFTQIRQLRQNPPEFHFHQVQQVKKLLVISVICSRRYVVQPDFKCDSLRSKLVLAIIKSACWSMNAV
jgi:hypothetical protein